jgi:hypothetical protein
MADNTKESPGFLHRMGVTTDGVYQGVIKMASGVGVAVDAINSGMKAAGLPMSDNPVGGSKWIKGNLTSAYNSYNNAIGYEPPKAVDRVDRVLHATGDLVGQVAVPVAATVAAANTVRATSATVTTTKDVINSTKNAYSYSNSVTDVTGVRSLGSAAGSGIATTVQLQPAFAISAAGVAGNAAQEMKGPEAAAPAQQQRVAAVQTYQMPPM